MILQQLIQAVDRPDTIAYQVKLLTEVQTPHQFESNKVYVQHLIMNQLASQFPNLNKVQIEGFVLKLFNTAYDWSQFKTTLRDLLISMKQFASLNDALYQEERDL
jgi:hypothetical protein